jgi:hypothetical protein
LGSTNTNPSKEKRCEDARLMKTPVNARLTMTLLVKKDSKHVKRACTIGSSCWSGNGRGSVSSSSSIEEMGRHRRDSSTHVASAT